MALSKVTSSRFNDFIYDPLYIVSGEKDYYKAAMVAKMSSAKFAICPIFPSMFSDLPHHPRQQLLVRTSGAKIPEYQDRVNASFALDLGKRPVDVKGVDRHKFFHSSIVQLTLDIPQVVQTPPPTPAVKKVMKKRNKKIQTQYRDSSAQTIPWQPGYFVTDGSDPELLMLDFLKWGSGLPAGMHEVRLIERARMKRAWEKALPPITDEASLEKRRCIIEAMERDEWAFREQEIQDIHDLRLELLQKMLTELLDKSKTRIQQKMKNFTQIKLAEKEEKLKSLRHNTQRELRKLRMKHVGVNKKYHKVNIVEEHGDKKSELYGPQMRHGDHPKRWHQVIDDHITKYRAQFLGVEEISTLPRWLDQAAKIKDEVKPPGTRLCIRETKWTAPVLKQLHEELKNLRKDEKRQCTLLVRVEKEESEILTPQIEDGDDWEEELFQAALFVQRILRGRASQVLIFEGRNRCRELIQELRSTHALQEEDRIKKFAERLEVKSQQRENVMCVKNATKLQETLNKISGTVVGTLLDFLNKELRRLLEERRIHAMCLLFERERHKRESAEAGRRQKEIRRRLEHDEMFKQVVKVNQDTVDLYLQDIITEGMEFSSSEEARVYVENLADKVDDQAYTTKDSLDFQEKEEIIASLVHNFLLPEVEKELVRDKIKKKQHNYLKTAHEAIYNKISVLPRPQGMTPEQLSEMIPEEEEANQKVVSKSKRFEVLQESVCIRGFEDLNLPETLSIQSSDLNLVYSGSADHRVSEVSSILELFHFQDDIVEHPDRLPRMDVDITSQGGSYGEPATVGEKQEVIVEAKEETVVEAKQEIVTDEVKSEMPVEETGEVIVEVKEEVIESPPKTEEEVKEPQAEGASEAPVKAEGTSEAPEAPVKTEEQAT